MGSSDGHRWQFDFSALWYNKRELNGRGWEGGLAVTEMAVG